jgi:hypothetical protein
MEMSGQIHVPSAFLPGMELMDRVSVPQVWSEHSGDDESPVSVRIQTSVVWSSARHFTEYSRIVLSVCLYTNWFCLVTHIS